MLLIFYLLSGSKNISNFIDDAGGFIIFLSIFELIVYVSPLIINFHVKKISYQNTELKNELSEIKNLLVYQNDILNSMRTPQYNQYYQQQPNNQNFQQQTYNNNNGNFSQY